MPRTKQSNSKASTGKPTSGQMFQAAMGLQNHSRIFADMKCQIRSIAARHLVISIPPQQQHDAYKRIEKEVMNMYPAFCRDNKSAQRLDHLQAYIGNWSRARHGDWARSRKEQPHNTIVKSEEEANRVRPPRAQHTRLAPRSESARPRSILRAVLPTGDDSLGPRSPIITQTLDAPGIPDTPEIPDIPEIPEAISFDPIAEFLETCRPSMAHLLPAFLAAGITTKEYLIGIAGWSEEDLVGLLRSKPILAFGSNFITSNVLEAETLRQHFKQYLKLTQSQPLMKSIS